MIYFIFGLLTIHTIIGIILNFKTYKDTKEANAKQIKVLSDISICLVKLNTIVGSIDTDTP